MFEVIFTAVIFGGCALLMVGIGVFQLRSKKPVGFYTGEKPPREDQLTDTAAWNRRHGTMWIVYGGCIVAGWVGMQVLRDDLLSLIPCFAGILLPIPVMIFLHHRLIRIYVKK